MDEKPAENAETANQEPQFQIRRLFSLGRLTWPLIILVVYVLSIGPAAKIDVAYDLARTYPRVERALEVLYVPIRLMVDNWDPAERLLQWYLGRVWGVPIEG